MDILWARSREKSIEKRTNPKKKGTLKRKVGTIKIKDDNTKRKVVSIKRKVGKIKRTFLRTERHIRLVNGLPVRRIVIMKRNHLRIWSLYNF